MRGMFKRLLSSNKHYYIYFNRIFGVMPKNIDLYKLALVHRSASVVLEDDGMINNERLEFLGDAILQAVVSDMIFIDHPDFDEGGLTRLRSKIVGRENLNSLAKEIGLDALMVTMPSSLVEGRKAILGDGLEALIGALYLDRGYDVTYGAVMRVLERYLDFDKIENTEEDFKSRVLEWGQQNRKKIEFLVKSSDNELDEELGFSAVLLVNGKECGYGAGRNKKQSEQRAAKQFFVEHLMVIDEE